VCFIFLFETVQTALTGADVWYWFMAGFGDYRGLAKNWFALIDIAIMGAIISLIVQLFFCYRIHTLNKRLWWLCAIIAVVSLISPAFREYSFIVSIQKLSFAGAAGGCWYGIAVSITRILFEIWHLTHVSGKRARDQASCICMFSIISLHPRTGLQFSALGVVLFDCIGGRPDFSSDGPSGTQVRTSESPECQLTLYNS
jgi:hypothetical protein